MPSNISLAFSTFLKYAELSPKRRQSELRKRLFGEGGYRFWEPLERLASSVATADADLEQIVEQVKARGSSVQIKCNTVALTKIYRLFKKLGNPDILSDRPVVRWQLGDSDFVIKVSPEICFKHKDNTYALLVWATRNPKLSPPTLTLGLAAARAALSPILINTKFLIYDTVVGRLFREIDMTSLAEISLVHAATNFSADLKAVLDGPAPGPMPPAHPSSPGGL